MINLEEQYITDQNGNRTAAIIPISKFEALKRLLNNEFELDEESPDCADVTEAIAEGLRDVAQNQTVEMKDLLNALRD